MKRLFAILLVAVLATSMSFASTAKSATGTVNVTVVTELTIQPASLDLGDIGIGDIRTGTWNLTFAVSGEAGWDFIWTDLVPATTNPTSVALTWTPPTTTPLTLSSGGTADLTFVFTQIDASGATSTGDLDFEYTTTVTYDY